MKAQTLSLIGGLILLGSWITQSTLYDYWSRRSSQLQQAEVIYLSFLSNSFILNAIEDTSKSAGYWNTMNFRTGLNYMIQGLPTAQRAKWDEMMTAIEADQLNSFGATLMTEIESQEQFIERWQTQSRWMFIITYVIGAIVLIIAERLKRKS
jgi:hypothetical protein